MLPVRPPLPALPAPLIPSHTAQACLPMPPAEGAMLRKVSELCSSAMKEPPEVVDIICKVRQRQGGLAVCQLIQHLHFCTASP